jgi:hypothetical protein
MSVMARRRNPPRRCRDDTPSCFMTSDILRANLVSGNPTYDQSEDYKSRKRRTKRRLITTSQQTTEDSSRLHCLPADESTFPFFELPRELRDHVYSYLTVHRTASGTPILDAASILRNKKKRIASQAVRDRLNRRRSIKGQLRVRARPTTSDPILHLNILQTSRRLLHEASSCLYSSNWFAITLNKLPKTVFETPHGWNLSQITKLQVELQLKDAARMNNYIDWTVFFSALESLRVLRIIPTYHPRYYDWAHTELCDWPTAHFVHKAFFRELVAAIPKDVDFKLGHASGISVREVQGKLLDVGLLEKIYEELSIGRMNIDVAVPKSV